MGVNECHVSVRVSLHVSVRVNVSVGFRDAMNDDRTF